MKYALAIPAFAFAMLLALVSLPWIVIDTGLVMLGERSRVIESSPLYRWFDYVEGR